MRPINLFLDMDGVFADFDGYWKPYIKSLGIEQEDRNLDRELFKMTVANKRMFANLEMLPNASGLKTCILALENTLKRNVPDLQFNIRMLTASGMDDTEHVLRCAEQKREWLKKHDFPWEALVVGRKVHKQLWCKGPNDFIIDDSQATIEQWNKNGGVGIHYEDFVGNRKENMLNTVSKLIDLITQKIEV